MTIFYLDYEGGSDAADGLSFANRWKTFALGATAARIAPGDTIRVMGSPAPTSLGQTATWTNGPLPATTAITSSTNATPISVLSTAHGLATGDTVIVESHTTNTKANGTWEVTVTDANNFTLDGSVGNGAGGATGTVHKCNNARIKLASAVTQAIALVGNRGTKTNWTASANVTCTVSTTDFKEGGESQQIAVAAAFTTGKAAYFATGTLNLSTYKQVSFWIKQTAGTIGAASSITLKLCSDIAGATAVNTINIPALGALNRWVPITIDTAAALGSAIASVGFYVNTDNGAQTFLIDCITACKDSAAADSLSLTSLIGKNTSTETWYGIQSINGTRVMLDNSTNAVPSATQPRGYTGVTETITTYKRETIKTAIAAAQATVINDVMDSGTLGSPISFEGGYDRTAMTTQNLETWFDGQSGNGIALQLDAKSYVSINNFGFTRYFNGVYLANAANFNTINNLRGSNNCAGVGVYILGASNCNEFGTVQGICNSTDKGIRVENSHANRFGAIHGCNNNSGPSIGIVAGSEGNRFGIVSGSSNTTGEGLRVDASHNNRFEAINVDVIGSVTSIFFFNARDNEILGGHTSGGTSRGVRTSFGKNYLRNFTINESTEVDGWTAFLDGRVYSENHDGTAGNHKIFCDGGLIASEASIRHTASGIAWALSPTSANRSAVYPLDLPLTKVAVAASALVTVKAWMRRSNTGLTLRLVCRAAQIAGVASEVGSAMTAAADTWEELTITFTPTEAGVVEIVAEAYGGTTYTGYVDDLTVTQA